MEVHHHNHAHGKKTWKSYFWEFLMLFLAVFCGFLAEYQLEHLIEHSREKQFIRSYIEDLETDTSAARKVYASLGQKQEETDSLMQLLRSGQVRGRENDLYFLARNMQRSPLFRSNDRTITQLMNSGSWRLIRKKEAADSMVSYHKLLGIFDINQEDLVRERKDCAGVLEKMFDPFVFDRMVDENGIHRPADNPPLRSYDRELQLDLAHKIHQIRGSLYYVMFRLNGIAQKGARLIELLKKEYHL